MKAIIRIVGHVKVSVDLKETLYRMRIHRKFTLALLPSNEATTHLLQTVRNFVAYGDITKETLKELILKRSKPIDAKKKLDEKNIDAIVESVLTGKKTLADYNIKPFFRLHPPRGGIDARLHFPKKKGVLGDNKDEINDLIRRML